MLGENSKGYIPATHQETNCRLVSYENEISRPNATARLRNRPRESDFEVPLARRSLLEQMAGTFFVIYSYSLVSYIFFRFSPGFSLVLFPFFAPFTYTPSHFQSYVRVCATNIEKDFAHVLSNREVIARISNVKYAFEMKKRLFGFTFQLMDLIRQ